MLIVMETSWRFFILKVAGDLPEVVAHQGGCLVGIAVDEAKSRQLLLGECIFNKKLLQFNLVHILLNAFGPKIICVYINMY